MLCVGDCAGLAASSSVISPILAPVCNKLKSNMSAVSRPPEGENKLHLLLTVQHNQHFLLLMKASTLTMKMNK